MSHYKLKPCPFCGEDTDLDWSDDSDPECDGRDWDTCLHFVSCCKCGARGPVRRYVRGEDSLDNAARAWNERPITPP